MTLKAMDKLTEKGNTGTGGAYRLFICLENLNFPAQHRILILLPDVTGFKGCKSHQ